MSKVNSMFLVLTLSVLGVAPADLAALEEVAQANLIVDSINAEFTDYRKSYRCTVTIRNTNDDTANNTIVKILLPVGVRVLSSSGCRPSPETTLRTHSYVTCHLGMVNPGTTRTVEVTTTDSRNSNPGPFGVLAWSDIPDPHPGDNFGTDSLP